MPTRAVLVSMAFLCISGPVRAWDDQGHMMIAAIAYDRLTPPVKARVAKLLSLNKYPVALTNDAGQADAAKARFMMAATAPDAIKGRKGFINDGDDAARAPGAAVNIGFSDKRMNKYWHYINQPFSPDGTPLEEPAQVNAQERIGLFRRTLASNAPDSLKAYDLVWLLHLVGDVHQPLHTASRFTQASPHGDAGGSMVKLGNGSLHVFWDTLPGTSSSVAGAIRAARALPPADPNHAAETDEATWVQESFDLAKHDAYAPPVGPALGPYSLDNAYRQNAKQLADAQMALAGARLANVLNKQLK